MAHRSERHGRCLTGRLPKPPPKRVSHARLFTVLKHMTTDRRAGVRHWESWQGSSLKRASSLSMVAKKKVLGCAWLDRYADRLSVEFSTAHPPRLSKNRISEQGAGFGQVRFGLAVSSTNRTTCSLRSVSIAERTGECSAAQLIYARYRRQGPAPRTRSSIVGRSQAELCPGYGKL